MYHFLSRRQALFFYIRRSIVVVFFTLIAIIVVLYARGYRVNPTLGTLEATGSINLAGNDNNVHIFLGKNEIGTKLPYLINYLQPNRTYMVTVSRDQYVSWHGEFYVEPQIVESADHVRLFKSTNTLTALQPTDVIDKTTLCQNSEPSHDQQIDVSHAELRTLSMFITRLSQPILDGCWLRDHGHIAYITKHSAHVIESTGFNDVTLLATDKTFKAVAVAKNDTEIYVQDTSGSWWKIVL